MERRQLLALVPAALGTALVPSIAFADGPLILSKTIPEVLPVFDHASASLEGVAEAYWHRASGRQILSTLHFRSGELSGSQRLVLVMRSAIYQDQLYTLAEQELGVVDIDNHDVLRNVVGYPRPLDEKDWFGPWGVFANMRTHKPLTREEWRAGLLAA